jgi:hypothetical protein
MARRIRGSRIWSTITAASEFAPGEASALQTPDNGKWTAPIVKDPKTAKPRSKDITAATTITFRGVAGRVIGSLRGLTG